MVAGILLIAGGVFMGIASRAPWAELPVGGGELATFSLGVKASGAFVVLATFLVIVGATRFVRGYGEDGFVQALGTAFVLIAVAIGVVVVSLFLNDHGLSVTALESYQKLQPEPGLYVAGAGAALALISRLA